MGQWKFAKLYVNEQSFFFTVVALCIPKANPKEKIYLAKGSFV
jgi:hypothetical protein